jgi:Zn-dependent protease
MKETPAENAAVLVCGINSTKLTFGEWWRTSPGLVAIIGWCSKLLRARILDSERSLIVRDAASLEIPMDQLSEEVRRKVLSQVEPLRQLGFGEPRVMRVTDVFTNRDIVLAVQLHVSGKTLARTVYAYPLSEATSKKKTFLVGFLSALSDGRLLCTDTRRSKFLCSPRILARWKRGDLAARYKAHEENILQISDAAVLSLTDQDIWRTCDHYESTWTAFQQSRGLFVPISDAEGANVAAITSPEEARRAGALAELVRLQTAKPRSMAGPIVLVISLAVFVWTGALAWSWQICATIGIALLVHEIGHYVAMRYFKYRDLRMFFIPLLGAAVTGTHHNVAGWKKAVVSLMGPLPGIFIGTGMAICAVVLKMPAVGNAALLVIILNLFNLLPILPLDGGWFWNAVLFCRHRWMEAGFKSLAAVALMISGVLSGGIWFVVGLGMLRGVPKTLRLGATAERLRARGWQPASDDMLSRETAETILNELKQPGKNPPAAKTAAADALNVFEHLNARPPNLLGSFGLVATYAVTIVVALIGLGAAVSAESGTRKKISDARKLFPHEQPPELKAEFHGEIAQLPAAGPVVDIARPSRRLIATFPDANSAAAAFDEIRTESGSIDQALQFGQTVLAVAPLKNNTIARELGARLSENGGTVLDTGAPLTWALFNLQFSAPNAEAAARLSRELQIYFSLPIGLRPTAPWATDPAVTPEKRAEYMKAAATYARVVEAQGLSRENPEMEPLMRPSVFRLFQSRKASLENLQEISAKRDQLRREAVKKLRASGDPTLDPQVLALALRQPKKIASRSQLEAIEKWHGQMRQLLTGRVDDVRETSADQYVSATVSVAGDRITLRFMSFPYPEKTLPALAHYLGEMQCADVRYGFYNAEVLDSRSFAALGR